MGDEHALDLVRRHPVAEGVHDVVVAAFEPDVALVIQRREVAAGEPLAPHHRRLFLGPVPVAEHQGRVGAVDGEQADLARRQRLRRALGRQDRDAAARLRLARRAGLDRGPRARRDVGRDLAHPERLVERRAGGRLPLGEELGRQRLARRDAVAQRREVVSREIGVFEDLPVEARHRREQGGAVAGDERRPQGRIAPAIVEHRRGAPRPGILDADAERVGPVHGAGMQHHVVLAQAEPEIVHRPPAPDRAVGVQHPFRPAGGAGGVDQRRRVVGGGVGISLDRWPGPQAGDVVAPQDDPAAAGLRIEGALVGGGDHRGAGILHQERRLAAVSCGEDGCATSPAASAAK